MLLNFPIPIRQALLVKRSCSNSGSGRLSRELGYCFTVLIICALGFCINAYLCSYLPSLFCHPSRERFSQDMLNENGKLLLGFAEDNKLALLNTFFFTPEIGVSYTFQSVNCSEEQACLDYILAKQADRRLICCVNVRRPPLKAPESDYNLVYKRVRIPRRSAPNGRKRMIIHPSPEGT